MALVASNVTGGTVLRGTAPISAQIFTVVASGSYTTGGDVLDLTVIGVPSANVPKFVRIAGIAGFVYQYVVGATAALGKMFVYCNTAGGANAAMGEHTAAGYVAGVSGDTITGLCYY